MNDIRDELCDAMRSLAKVAPHMRWGQLIAAAGEMCTDLHGRGLWDAEDNELLEAIWKLSSDLEQHAPTQVPEVA
jgi:hypothetical protein